MKKIIKSIACICLTLAVAIGSCFGAMKLTKNQRFLGTSYNKASAYVLAQNSFISSNFIGKLNCSTGFDSTVPPLTESASSLPLYSYSFKFEIETFSNGYNLKTYANILGSDLSSAVPPGSAWTLNSIVHYTFRQSGSLENTTSYTTYNHISSYYSNGQSRNLRFGFYTYASFGDVSSSNYHNLDIQYVEIGNSSTYSYDDIPSQDGIINFNYYRFVDSNGFYITIVIPLNTYHSNAFYAYPVFFDYRVYYLNSTPYLNNNDYYQNGLKNGYDVGYADGEYDGYSEGFSQGKSEGFNNGYNQGLESSERLGFPALITSVIDVPVKVFTSLFNFEILGVNILTFVTSLLSIALILAIVRKVKSD